MFNKLVNFVQHSDVAKFFVVGFIIAAVHSFTGHFSILPWIAVVLGIIPSATNLPFLADKISKNQIEQIKFNSLVFSALAWAIYIGKDLQDFPEVFAFTYAALMTAIIILFDSIKLKMAMIAPLLGVFLLLLVFIMVPSAIVSAVLVFVFTLLFLGFDSLTKKSEPDTVVVSSKPQNPTDKLELVAKYDEQVIENQHLQEQVKQIEIDLSAAEMAKMEFLATMSHEIRTPLNGIIPLLDILLDSELSDFQRDYLSTAHVSAILMQKLIDDLLDYSKVEAGKLSVEVRGLKVLRIMAAVNSSFQKAAQKKNLNIEVDVHRDVSPLLRGDPTRLRQVLSNLLSNAIKFSKRGTIKIVARKIKDFPNKEIIRFEVIDQGIGLDKETCENIFLPFTQEDGSSTRKFGGTGLGLAISKKIVELMQGTIYVESKKGRGSNFYFDLPLLKSVGETTVSEEQSSYQAILVNTNPLLFNKIGQSLKSEGVSFQKALGLSQAYEIYASIKKISQTTKNILIFIDFETAGKQVRSLCQDLADGDSMENLYACVLSDRGNIAGIPQQANIKLLGKNDSISELLNKIEIMQASEDARASSQLEAHDDENDDEGKYEDSQEQKQQTTPKPLAVANTPPGNLLPEVLLVEDNEVNLKVAEKLIQYIGYPFDFAMNGQEALEKVKINRYRMILMDCQMPVMDGYRATAKIRDYELAAGLNRTPILAMTANAMLGDREKCLDAGMDDYMSKPLNRFVLEKTLKKWDPLVNGNMENESVETSQSQQEKEETPAETTQEQEKTPDTKVSIVEKPVETPKTKEPDAPKADVIINEKWLSTKALSEIKEFMGEEIVQLLEMFEQETPTIIKKMRTAIQSHNYGDVEKMAHMLKSTSANIGANGLSFFSRKMEIAASNSEGKVLVETYNKIKKAYILTSKEVAKYVSIQ